MDDHYIVEIVEALLLLLRNYILFKVSVHNSIVGWCTRCCCYDYYYSDSAVY